MRINTVRTCVAVVVIFGHLFVFVVGLSIGVFALLSGVDAIQTILMASPVLSATALAAFSYILAEANDERIHKIRANRKVSGVFAAVTIVFPVFLLSGILVLFFIFWVQIDGFGSEQLKISLGALETFFGVYLGAISRTLFGNLEAKEISAM